MKTYNINFSSIQSCNTYNVYINKITGYYELESSYGNIKDSGFLFIDIIDCNYNQLNNYAFNIINEFLNNK